LIAVPIESYAIVMRLNFVWHYRGRIVTRGNLGSDELLDCHEGMLVGQSKETSRGGDSVSFKVPIPLLSGGSRWDAMALFDSGAFWLDGPADDPTAMVSFDLSCFWGFLFCLMPVAIGAVVGLNDPEQGAIIAIMGFGWLYGVNQILARIRIP